MSPVAVDELDDVIFDGMVRHMEREAAAIEAERRQNARR